MNTLHVLRAMSENVKLEKGPAGSKEWGEEGEVYRFVFVENSRIVRGGVEEKSATPGKGPVGTRRICLRFISDRN